MTTTMTLEYFNEDDELVRYTQLIPYTAATQLIELLDELAVEEP